MAECAVADSDPCCLSHHQDKKKFELRFEIGDQVMD